MQIGDAVFGALIAALGAYMIYTASSFPSFPGQPYGAALLPTLLGIAFITCGALLILRDIRARRRADGPMTILAIEPALRDARGAISGALIIATVLAQILLGDLIGFIPISLVMLLTVFLWFSVKPVTAIVFAILGTAVTWWLFSYILKVPLPRGLLDGVL